MRVYTNMYICEHLYIFSGEIWNMKSYTEHKLKYQSHYCFYKSPKINTNMNCPGF